MTIAFGCSEKLVENIARVLINLSYLMFGPVLLCFVNFGFTHFKTLAFVCSPRGITHQVNFVDIVVLLCAFVLSLCVTFTMAMQKTLDMAQQSFTDENSIIYRVISYYFGTQIRLRNDRERAIQRERQIERRASRRQREQEREDLLAQYTLPQR